MATAKMLQDIRAIGIGAFLSRLEGTLTLSNLSRGTQFFGRGDPCDRVYALRSGRVKISVDGPGGKHCLFHVVEPGELFGEEGLLGETSHTAASEVLDRAAVAMAPLKSVEVYLARYPELWSELAPLLQKRMRSLQEQVVLVSFLEVEQRIARLVLRWAESVQPASDDLVFQMSQRDLAGMIGATRETTSTALNRLQRAGCIEIRRRCLVLQSRSKLRLHVGGDQAPTGMFVPALATPELVRVRPAGA
jgi:CRP/FNR family transcriptional regulator